MPTKKDAATELAEKMLRVLQTQRELGTSAYPVTLRRLAELADPAAETQTIQKAVKKKTFGQRTVVAQAKNLDCPVALVEDAEQLAASPVLLEYLLESLCTTAKPTIEIAKLKNKAPASVREAFGTALDRRLADNTLPPGVAVVTVKKKLHLHLQRYPLPRKPEEVLAEELVKVLGAHRQLGARAYPTSLARLIEITRPGADNKLVDKAMKHAIFKDAVVLSMNIKKQPGAPVALAQDKGRLADSPQLLEMAMRQTRSETDQLLSPAKLKAKVDRQIQKAFEESIKRRASDGQLPPGIGRLMQKKKPLLFLIGDIVSGNAECSGREQAPQTRPATDFARAFDDAFQRLEKEGRSHNFVSLLDLRCALPFDSQAFNAGLHELRRAGRYTLSAAEGRHGISAEEQQAGIIEDGALLLYVSRKLS